MSCSPRGWRAVRRSSATTASVEDGESALIPGTRSASEQGTPGNRCRLIAPLPPGDPATRALRRTTTAAYQ
jgi:hypothetical protein